MDKVEYYELKDNSIYTLADFTKNKLYPVKISTSGKSMIIKNDKENWVQFENLVKLDLNIKTCFKKTIYKKYFKNYKEAMNSKILSKNSEE